MAQILVVDDHPATVELIGEALTGAGYSVVSAASGPEAALLAQAQRPDLMILDLILPGPDGLDVLLWLRQALPGPRVPVIILTVRTDEADRELALARGADLYLTKPFTMPALLAAVRQALGTA